jgi:Caspase domain/LysM domain
VTLLRCCQFVIWMVAFLAVPAIAQPELAKDIGIREANPGAKFLALVIGVSNYGNAQVKVRGAAAPVPIPSLPGPREDAQDMASLVRQMGFVISNENRMFDLDRAAMQLEITRFVNQLDEQTVALVYYSGHGLENQNENYLVPRSANLESVDHLKGQLVSLNEMLRDVGNRRAKARIVILDACRNFPDLEGGMKSLGETGGFGEVKIGAGLRLVYAAEPGQRALPARAGERNSVFTKPLLTAVREPALGTFDQVINRAGEITQELTRRSDGSSFQQPWIAGSAGLTFRLRARPGPIEEKTSSEDLAWAKCRDDGSTASCADYLSRWPQGRFVSQAIAKLQPRMGTSGTCRTYTVKPGDTLIRIGLDAGVPWRDIARWNGGEGVAQ